eukprot:scaffold4919_cov21-Tisochrysis_lutea.AAC.1
MSLRMPVQLSQPHPLLKTPLSHGRALSPSQLSLRYRAVHASWRSRCVSFYVMFIRNIIICCCQLSLFSAVTVSQLSLRCLAQCALAGA